MDRVLPFILTIILRHANLSRHIQPMVLRARIDKRPIEIIPVIRDIHNRICLSNMLEKSSQKREFIYLIIDMEVTLELIFWRVLKVFNIFGYDFSVYD
jgi:hypothetical protein